MKFYKHSPHPLLPHFPPLLLENFPKKRRITRVGMNGESLYRAWILQFVWIFRDIRLSAQSHPRSGNLSGLHASLAFLAKAL